MTNDRTARLRLALAAAGLVAGVLLLQAGATWLQVRGSAAWATGAGLLLGWAMLIGAAVRALRAAWPHGAAARATMGAAAAAVLGVGALDAAPRVADWAAHALGRDPLGPLQATLSPDGSRLRLQGPLGAGSAGQVTALLQGARPWLVELDSAGGRLDEARTLAALLRERGVTTRAVGPCDNVCALPFLAGRLRQLGPQGSVGLQRLAPGSMLGRPLADRWLATALRDAGLPPAFVPRMLFASPRVAWRPGRDEWAAAGITGVPGRPLDLPLPPPARADAAALRDAMAAHDLWPLLERLQPGLIDAAAAQALAAHGQGDEAAQLAAQRLVEPLWPALLQRAGQPLLELWAALRAEQLAAMAGDAACRALLQGDAAAQRVLPAPLAERQAAWIAEAAVQPEAPPRPLRPIEREVLRRALGERAAALLPALRPGSSAAPGCDEARTLLDGLGRLGPSERGLALRAAFVDAPFRRP